MMFAPQEQVVLRENGLAAAVIGGKPTRFPGTNEIGVAIGQAPSGKLIEVQFSCGIFYVGAHDLISIEPTACKPMPRRGPSFRRRIAMLIDPTLKGRVL